MANIIQVRRDTSDNWTAANPILAQGEYGYEVDTYRFKIGNGLSGWNTLLYWGTQGETGIQGLEGQTGLKGIDGQTGIQGETGIIGLTGIQGLTGICGQTGIQGKTGFDGVTGIYGQTGIQGLTGLALGATGIEGITGLRGPGGGDQGFTGLTGPTGIQGLTGLGLANFIEDDYPAIVNQPQLLWNFKDECLLLGVTGLGGNWVQLGAGCRGDTGIKGGDGPTGLQGITGLANWLDTSPYPALGLQPQLLWNEDDQALFASINGADRWVQISQGSLSGPTGLKGPTGITGQTGIRGFTGIYGQTGIRGVTGIYGLTGIKGSTGIMGVTGIYGQTGLGLANFIEDGFPAITDPPQLLWNFADESLYLGITGINGNWVQLGAGSRGATGLFGPTGIQGVTGLRGPTGIQGVTGIRGQTGIQGNTGLQGRTGIQGIIGAGSSARVFTWSVRNPIAGGIPGPRLKEGQICTRLDSYVTSGTNCIYNVEDRTSIGTFGTNVGSDRTATTTGNSLIVFTGGTLPADSWLWLNIKSQSGNPSNLVVTLSTVLS